MSRRSKLLTAVICVAFVAYLLYSSLALDQVSCQVCIEFKGGRECGSASGTSAEEAQKTAAEVACAVLASGRTESMACSNSKPVSVDCR